MTSCNKLKKSTYILFAVSFVILFLTSCVVYTEKRSQALSRAVAATADSIEVARIDLASKYSKEAEKIAFPPKTRIVIKPLLTTSRESIKITNTVINANVSQPLTKNSTVATVNTSIINIKDTEKKSQTVVRLVIPQHLRHAKLLIENSEEWNELLQIQEFSDQLKSDNQNLKNLISEVEEELIKQQKMRDEMVISLNQMQKQLLKKDLAILQRNVIIGVLILLIGLGVYLRIKGVL